MKNTFLPSMVVNYGYLFGRS